ncbi:MAG: ORF6N domain-containing protein [Prolixibacteraceae bacterium]|nr:ORF6N domain-containing protein [Prolixibacteraceae bacterium]
MNKAKNSQITVPDEVIMTKIYLVRGQKVMLDRDLAELPRSPSFVTRGKQQLVCDERNT